MFYCTLLDIDANTRIGLIKYLNAYIGKYLPASKRYVINECKESQTRIPRITADL